MDGAGYIFRSAARSPVNKAREILLMPGSRAELLIDAARLCDDICRADTSYQLVTAAFQAGYAPNDADTWPQIALARISVPANGPKVEASVTQQAHLFAALRNYRPLVVPVADIAAACRGADGNASSYAIRLADGEKRRIYFGIFSGKAANGTEIEDFVLGVTVLHADNREFDLTGHPIDTISNPVRLHTMNMESDLVDLCVEHGREEVWQLVNVPNEVHNFHIHQVKFTVKRHLKGRPVWRVPSPIDEQVLPNDLVFIGGEAELQHDTIVVPRGRSQCGDSLMPLPPLPDDGARAYTLSHRMFSVPENPSSATSKFSTHNAMAQATDLIK